MQKPTLEIGHTKAATGRATKLHTSSRNASALTQPIYMNFIVRQDKVRTKSNEASPGKDVTFAEWERTAWHGMLSDKNAELIVDGPNSLL